MSRIAVVVILTLAAPMPAAAQDAIFTTYKQMTDADPDCRRKPVGDEILVCGRRDANRYRVPFIVREPGDPRGEGLWSERARLQHITTPCQDRGPFLIGCGMVGISVGIGLGGGAAPKLRGLAP
jgi:hypothetical protein